MGNPQLSEADKLKELISEVKGLRVQISALTTLMLISLQQQEAEMAAIDDLTVQVKANTDTEDSALILINGIAARIAAAGVDPAALAALQVDLKQHADALAAAVVANTPPAPPAPAAAKP